MKNGTQLERMHWFRQLVSCKEQHPKGTLRDSKKTPHKWPSATERIRAAKAATQEGKTWIAPAITSPGTTVRYCIHPDVATAFLERNEDCYRDDKDDDDDEQQEEKCCPFLLHKPTKPNHLLLRHALTNVNGDDWRRQRPLVAKALNQNAKQIQSIVQATAATTIVRWCSSTNRQLIGVDVRQLALTVAVETISTAVVSSDHATPHLRSVLRKLFEPTLLPIRATTEATQELHALVSAMVKKNDGRKLSVPTLAACCIADSLLQQDGLTDAEVVSNIHSALLAGTQTMATTLTTAIVLLLQQQQETSNDASSHALCQQALRLLPPVASLPRCCPRQTSNNKKTTTTTTTTFLVDLLALAHAGNSPSPWGIGDRSCPAGSLSVVGVTAALDALRSRWTITDPQRTATRNDWMDGYGISYRPTLTFANPVTVSFGQLNKGR